MLTIGFGAGNLAPLFAFKLVFHLEAWQIGAISLLPPLVMLLTAVIIVPHVVDRFGTITTICIGTGGMFILAVAGSFPYVAGRLWLLIPLGIIYSVLYILVFPTNMRLASAMVDDRRQPKWLSTVIAISQTVNLLGIALAQLVCPWLLDEYGLYTAAMPGAVLFGISLLLLGCANSSLRRLNLGDKVKVRMLL
jgi:MFS family permease